MGGTAARRGMRRLAAGMLLLIAFAPARARADLAFPAPVADAGEVRSGVPLAHRFAFRNTGNLPAEITDVRGSCGCLTPKLESRVLAPGQEGTVLLEVNTLGQAAGPHRWRVTLSYRAGDTIYVTPLLLTARVVTEVSVQPASLTVFADQPVIQELVLSDRRRTPLTLTRVQATSPTIHAAVAGQYRDPAGRLVRRIRVEVSGDCPEGRRDEAVYLFTDDPQYAELRVPVTVVRRSRQALAVSPSQITVEVPSGQGAASKLVVLRDRDNRPVVVEGVACDDPAVDCQWATNGGAVATVRITVARSRAQAPAGEADVRVTVSSPVRETVTVPLSFALR